MLLAGREELIRSDPAISVRKGGQINAVGTTGFVLGNRPLHQHTNFSGRAPEKAATSVIKISSSCFDHDWGRVEVRLTGCKLQPLPGRMICK